MFQSKLPRRESAPESVSRTWIAELQRLRALTRTSTRSTRTASGQERALEFGQKMKFHRILMKVFFYRCCCRKKV